MERPIHEFQYPRNSDFLYELWRQIPWPRILNPTNVWFLFNPRKLVPTKIKPSTVFVCCFYHKGPALSHKCVSSTYNISSYNEGTFLFCYKILTYCCASRSLASRDLLHAHTCQVGRVKKHFPLLFLHKVVTAHKPHSHFLTEQWHLNPGRKFFPTLWFIVIF